MKIDFKKLDTSALSGIFGGSGGCSETIEHGDGSATVIYYDTQGNVIAEVHISC